MKMVDSISQREKIMTIAKAIVESIDKSSWIRKMFEEGAKLKARFGNENVFDFSLGNPDLDPPKEFLSLLQEIVKTGQRGAHGYMPNAGYPGVRNSIAEQISAQQQVTINQENIIMTCGAAGGLNIVLKTILDPGDQVIVPRPYFVEYGFYVSNHGGEIVLADTNPDFTLNIKNIEKAITKKTKAVLINSPNNPTGKIYSESEIAGLASLLESRGSIFLISDEPYREIVYADVQVPSILKHYRNSIAVTSYSKSLSIPGERIGYVAANPLCEDIDALMAGLVLSNRILGFVNAPALMQRIVADLGHVRVDVEAYRRRRDLFVKGLKDAGYDLNPPDGAFYIFCKSPLKDDVAFVKHLLKYNILAVPGLGFGGPGYFRCAYCVPEDVISRSLPKFKQALQEL